MLDRPVQPISNGSAIGGDKLSAVPIVENFKIPAIPGTRPDAKQAIDMTDSERVRALDAIARARAKYKLGGFRS